jgi:N-lysine methyltransferase SETD6
MHLRYRAYNRAFEIPYSGKIPEEMYVFCLSMMASSLTADTIPEYRKTAELKQAMLKVLAKRKAEYSTSIEEDEKMLQGEIPARQRMAIEVRLGEKRILKKAKERVEAWDTEPPTKRQKR